MENNGLNIPFVILTKTDRNIQKGPKQTATYRNLQQKKTDRQKQTARERNKQKRTETYRRRPKKTETGQV